MLARLRKRLRELEIDYGEDGHLVVFATERERYDAVMKVYASGWENEYIRRDLKKWLDANDPSKVEISNFIMEV